MTEDIKNNKEGGQINESEIDQSQANEPVEFDKKDEIKRHYILTFIINLNTNTDETDKTRVMLSEKLESLDASISSSICQESPKHLSYPIKKMQQGYLCETVFEAKPESIHKIESEIKTYPNILRYMIEVKRALPKKQLKKRTASYRAERMAGIGKEKIPTPSRDKISMEEIEKKIDEIIDNI